jgi:predicted PolB exonuclease-like 3'-5' exonuclease
MNKATLNSLRHILFIDIETVGAASDYQSLPDRLRSHWDYKANFLRKDEKSSEELFNERGGIYAEFGKVVCIGMGYITSSDQGTATQLRIKTLSGDHEKVLLQEFADILADKFNDPKLVLCAHNGKEFDFPYLCRRMIVNQVKLPTALQIAGKKPWEIAHIDTLELWKFGDYKHYTSLDLLAALMGIDTSKNELSGDQVNETYYREHDLPKIATYCAKDVAVLAQLYLCLSQAGSPDELEIIYT